MAGSTERSKPMEQMTTFEKLRRGLGITKSDLSEITRVSRPTINRIEQDRLGRPQRRTVERLAPVFGLSATEMRQILDGEEQLSARVILLPPELWDAVGAFADERGLITSRAVAALLGRGIAAEAIDA